MTTSLHQLVIIHTLGLEWRRSMLSNRYFVVKHCPCGSCLILHVAYLSVCAYTWRGPKLTLGIRKICHVYTSLAFLVTHEKGAPVSQWKWLILREALEVFSPAAFLQVFGALMGRQTSTVALRELAVHQAGFCLQWVPWLSLHVSWAHTAYEKWGSI